MTNINVIKRIFQDSEGLNNSAWYRIRAIFISRVKMALNYKSAYFMTVILNLVTVFLYFFFGELSAEVSIGGIPVVYFEFAIIGLSLQMVIGTALATTNNSLYSEILSGTFSSLLQHFNLFEYSLGTSLAGISLASLSIFVSFGVSIVFLGLEMVLTLRMLLLVIVLFILLMLSHMVISMFFAAFIIYYKKDTGIITMLYSLTKTFSGIVFPVALLSGSPFAFIISRILPLTWGLESIHAVLFNPSGAMNMVLINGGVLIGFILILGAIAWFLVRHSIKISKIKGTVEFY